MTPLKNLQQTLHDLWKKAIDEREKATFEYGFTPQERARRDGMHEGRVEALLSAVRLVNEVVYKGERKK